MNKTLHIVNGDSTAQVLAKSFIHGDVIVWREMLCEGSLHKNIGSDEFWKTRYSYFESEVGVSKLEYFDKTIKEIQKIEDIANYKEVVLWFEFDLFCQVNLLALCTYLLKFYRKDITYSLICTGREKRKETLQSLSDYSPDEYEKLLNKKVKLSRNNFLFAEECWSLYVENDKQKIMEFDFNKCSKFSYLQKAMDQHVLTFSNQNGLSQIETKILNTISIGGHTKNKIVKELLHWQQKETVYGFGDLQYFLTLEKLEKYYTVENETFILNKEGKELMA